MAETKVQEMDETKDEIIAETQKWMAASTKYEEIADDEENSTSTVNTELDRAKY